jgi:PAS domain S-box-containing protein
MVLIMFGNHIKNTRHVDLESFEIESAAQALSALAKGEFYQNEQRKSVDTNVFKANHCVKCTTTFVKEKFNKLDQYNAVLMQKGRNFKKSKDALKQRKIVEDAIISYLGESMMVVDPNLNIVLINKRAKDLFGYETKTSLHRKPYFNYVVFRDGRGEEISAECDPINFALTMGSEVKITFSDGFYCVKKDGTTFPVTLSISPLLIDKVIKGVVIIFHDATREKQLDEVKSDFISIAAHQLRTPLTVTSLHTELLLSGHLGRLNKEQEAYIKSISFYNKKISDLLNNFMVASKAELKTLEIDARPTNLAKLLDDIFYELDFKIVEKKLNIVRLYETIPEVSIDPTCFRIVLHNLVSNAIKYTAQNGFITSQIVKNAKNITISIKDTGIGIPDKEQDRIFLKLFRGANAKNQDHDGTGLGLYITKTIVDKSGCDIWFKSKEGEGSIFYVSIPIKG